MVRYKGCRCKPERSITDSTHRTCRYGRCLEWHCPDCKGNLGGVGPVGCKCDGYIRELFYPDMMAMESHVPVKPSIVRRRNQKRKTRERFLPWPR